MTDEPKRLLFGTDEPVAEPLALRCGALETQMRGTRLGPVWLDGHEVWHGVDFLYRDPDWGTPAPVVDAMQHTAHASGFRILLQGHIGAASRIDFQITIDADGQALRYEAQAQARADVPTSRTGVVLMHPLSVCGRRIDVEHVDGRHSASTFPTLIAPWPPFMLVRAIRHEFADGAWATCRFAGDDFELEDQRNNADASFKTYSRSNLMPRPYLLRAGAPLRQSVELRVETRPAVAVRTRSQNTPGPGPVEVHLGEAQGPLPEIGVAISPADALAPARARLALRTLAPGLLHLVLDSPGEPLDAPALARMLADAGSPRLRIDIGGVDAVDPHGAMQSLSRAFAAATLVPERIAAFPSTPAVLDAARTAFPASRIGGGTPHFFTQLNRIEDLGRTDFLTFTTASVVHGADDKEIMAGLQSLPSMVHTLRLNRGTAPLHVGPSSIGARRSPLGGQPPSDGTRRLAFARRDPRTRGLYGAAWALGYIARLADAGVEAITLFDLQGDAAVLVDGKPTPAFELLSNLSGATGRRQVTVSHPAEVAALSIERGDDTVILLGNLGGRPKAVRLHGQAYTAVTQHVRVMDATSLMRFCSHPDNGCWRTTPLVDGQITLAPYAVALI